MGETRKTAWKGPVVKYTALMLLALSTVLLLLVNLSGVTSSGFLTDLWFSQYTDGQSVDGFYYKRWTLYRLCGATYDKSITACSKKVAAYPLNPASVILSFSNITSPSRYKKYIDMSKAAYALLLILLIVTFAALVTKLVVLKLPKPHHNRELEVEQDERGRSREEKSVDVNKAPTHSPGKQKTIIKDLPQLLGDMEDDDEMFSLMGFSGFGTTKGKSVAGTQGGAVGRVVSTDYRQYMNREKGFNRPLSPGRK
ncbi:uncharacterized protein KQ657_005151 [Scheffersomyces spartinae]|uniref:U4/U6.U5 small nuclear ribonucleoprotein 27kDa protein domain-containing protein n=1 Tax=Scheffersomyces spartinae TaxID=45513 RepID=A0A9P8AJA1_9ASCO|nr:uncharacterized protein KQ657_005151 [Scheffersomyces spartinae]KAG7193952.1 hypothetical protein KQ657_005151 [Scheffersomyces spartinae]